MRECIGDFRSVDFCTIHDQPEIACAKDDAIRALRSTVERVTAERDGAVKSYDEAKAQSQRFLDRAKAAEASLRRAREAIEQVADETWGYRPRLPVDFCNRVQAIVDVLAPYPSEKSCDPRQNSPEAVAWNKRGEAPAPSAETEQEAE